MLTFAFDAGGDSETPMLTVAGFVSSVEDWDKFTTAWTDRLKRDGIEYFHAADLDGFWGPFRHWQDKPNRKTLSKNLCTDLMNILQSNVYQKFGCTVINEFFEEMPSNLREEFALCAYSVAGRTCEKRARKWALETFGHGKPVSVELVFEAGDKGKGNLQNNLRGRFTPTFRPKKDVVLEDGSRQPGFIPLQASDWLAHEINKAARLMREKGAEGTADFRWPMQQFARSPNGYLGTYTLENIKEMEKGIILQKEIIEWAKKVGLDKKNKKP